MAPKREDYDLVRRLIGSLVADLSVKKFVLQATGIEGGFTVCLVPNGEAGSRAMIEKMRAIQVDPRESFYEQRFVEQCAEQ